MWTFGYETPDVYDAAHLGGIVPQRATGAPGMALDSVTRTTTTVTVKGATFNPQFDLPVPVQIGFQLARRHCRRCDHERARQPGPWRHTRARLGGAVPRLRARAQHPCRRNEGVRDAARLGRHAHRRHEALRRHPGRLTAGATVGCARPRRSALPSGNRS